MYSPAEKKGKSSEIEILTDFIQFTVPYILFKHEQCAFQLGVYAYIYSKS